MNTTTTRPAPASEISTSADIFGADERCRDAQLGTPRAGAEKQHIDAYRVVSAVLSDGEWHLRSELVTALSAQLDNSMIDSTKTFKEKGAKAAWHNIAESVVQSGLRHGTIERRRAAADSRMPSTVRLVQVG